MSRGGGAVSTSEYVILVVLVGLWSHFNETVQAIIVNKLVDQILVILKKKKKISIYNAVKLILAWCFFYLIADSQFAQYATNKTNFDRCICIYHSFYLENLFQWKQGPS